MTLEEKLEYIYQVRDERKEDQGKKLVEILKNDKEFIIREAIRDTLKDLKPKNIIKDIIDLFYSDDLYLRNVATEILASYEGEVIPYLSEILENEKNEHVRKLALDTLFLIQDPSVVDAIAKALKDPAPNNLTSAIEYIGKLGGEKYAHEIANILKEADNPFLMVTSLEALSEIGDEETVEIVKEKFPDPLKLDDFIFPAYIRAIMKQASLKNLYFVLELLEKKGKLFYKELIDMLEKIINGEKELSQSERYEIYKTLRKLFNFSIPSMNKYEILNLIGDLGYKEAIEFLYDLLDSDDFFIKMGAIEAIGKLSLKEEKIIKKLEEIIEKEENEDIKAVSEEVLSSLKEE